jgi:nucleoid DNA-binding protein
MDKPTSMSVKDFLVRKLSVQLMTSEKTIEAVVNHQFQSANIAMQENETIEMSGFGKLYFNKKKAQKKMDKMLSKAALFTKQTNNAELSEQKRTSAANKLANTLIGIETLKPKLHAEHLCTDLRGMEEQAGSPSSFEGAD